MTVGRKQFQMLLSFCPVEGKGGEKEQDGKKITTNAREGKRGGGRTGRQSLKGYSRRGTPQGHASRVCREGGDPCCPRAGPLLFPGKLIVEVLASEDPSLGISFPVPFQGCLRELACCQIPYHMEGW